MTNFLVFLSENGKPPVFSRLDQPASERQPLPMRARRFRIMCKSHIL